MHLRLSGPLHGPTARTAPTTELRKRDQNARGILVGEARRDYHAVLHGNDTMLRLSKATPHSSRGDEADRSCNHGQDSENVSAMSQEPNACSSKTQQERMNGCKKANGRGGERNEVHLAGRDGVPVVARATHSSTIVVNHDPRPRAGNCGCFGCVH